MRCRSGAKDLLNGGTPMPREVVTMGIDASREPADNDAAGRHSADGFVGRESDTRAAPERRNRCRPQKSGWRRGVKRAGLRTTPMPPGAVKLKARAADKVISAGQGAFPGRRRPAPGGTF